MGNVAGREFAFGKTFMDGSELIQWMKIDEFVAELDLLKEKNETINDASILRIIDELISRHAEDTDGSFPLEWAISSANSFRRKIPKAYFDKKWLKEAFPEVWTDLQSLRKNDDMVIIPFQMHKFVQFLKAFKEKVDSYNLTFSSIRFDKNKNCATVTVAFNQFRLDKRDPLISIWKALKVCNEVAISTVDNHTELELSVPDVFIPRDEYEGEKNKKKAWTLQWNQHYISKDEESPFASEDGIIEEEE